MPIQRLKATMPAARPEGIDRKGNVLRGYVMAQAGPFKSDGRGEFDTAALQAIVKLGNAAPNGLKSRLGHPTMSDDGVGKFLGRARNLRMSRAEDARTGDYVSAVRGDLHFDPTAADTPHGNLSKYVMDLAESDAGAISSSLVLQVDEEMRLNKDGTGQTDAEGNLLPPLWRPTALHASDIVDTGDAVDALLSPQELSRALSIGLTPDLQKLLRFDNVARLSTQLLDGIFAKQSRREIERRCQTWLARYLAERFPGAAGLMATGGAGYSIGDRVRVVAGQEHGEGMGGAGTVREISTPALGIELDSMPGEVHHWYVAAELEPEGDPAMIMKPRLRERIERMNRLAAATRKLFTHNSTVADSEPSWGSIDKTALPMLAFADHGDGADQKSTWAYPHHWVQNASNKNDQGVWTTGTLLLHAGGLNAAWAAANGARSGQKASAAVIAHLQAHRRALGLD